MNRKTRKALLESIFIKWESILSCKGDENGSDDCPLCKMFLRKSCEGCPISTKTGLVYCENTPYGAWSAYAPEHNGNTFTFTAWLGEVPSIDVIYLAVKEQEFLISLLSKKDRDNLERIRKDFITKYKEG